MKKGVVVLLVGIILLVSAIGIFAYSGSYIGENVKNITLKENETKSIEYDLKAGNYAFVLSSSGKISYIFENSTGVVKEEKNITQATTGIISRISKIVRLMKFRLYDNMARIMPRSPVERLIALGQLILRSGSVIG